MFNFVRVVVGPGVRTAAVAWEAPAKRSQAFYLFLSDDRSIAGGVAAAGIAAAGCWCFAAAAAAAAGTGVEAGGGPQVGTEAIGAGRWCGKIV